MEKTPINNLDETENGLEYQADNNMGTIEPYDLSKLYEESEIDKEQNDTISEGIEPEDSSKVIVEPENIVEASEKKRGKLFAKIGAAAIAVAIGFVGAYHSFKTATNTNEEVKNAMSNNNQPTIESTQSSHNAVQAQETAPEASSKNVEQNNSSTNNSNETSSSKPESTSSTSIATSSENNTNKTESETPKEQLISSLEIPAGLSPEEYSNDVIKDFEKWRNYGYVTREDDTKLMQDWMNYSGTLLEKFAAPISEDNANIFAEALFVSNYKENANLVSLYGRQKDLNMNAIATHLYTELDKENRSGSYLSCKFNTASELYNTGTERAVRISFYESINMEDLTSSKNTLTQITDKPFEFIVTSKVDNGIEKISDFTWTTEVKEIE